MNRLVIAVLVSVVATGSHAESRIFEACYAALDHYVTFEIEAVREVKDFSELMPPRVTFLHGPQEVPIEVRCQFEDAESPVGLTEFCWMGRCAPSMRLEELRVLLERDGY